MRLRTTLPAATAAALLAVTLAVPAQAMADQTPTATPADTSSASASASATPTATPTATDTSTPAPTDSGSATATPSAPTAGPTFGGTNDIKTATGTALTAQISDTDQVSAVTATITPAVGSGTSTTVQLTQQTSDGTNSTWQTTAPLGLAYGSYAYTIHAVDSAGNAVDSQPNSFDYYPSADFHNVTFSPTVVSYAHQTVTVSGTVTTYDPATGDTGKPFTGAPNATTPLLLSWPAGNDWLAVGSDGSFSTTVSPGYGNTLFTLYGYDTDSTVVLSQQVTSAAPQATRIVLDHTGSTGALAGSALQVSGTAEYQDASGNWQPLANNPVEISGAQFTYDYLNTDANGRFSFPTSTPDTGETWTVHTGDEFSNNPFLQPSSATYTVSGVQQQMQLNLANPSIDEYSDLTFQYTVTSTNNLVGGGKVYVLESPNGRTGWKNLGYIPVNKSTWYTQISAWVDNPHGYWKLWYPGAPGYAAAYSNVIHTFRFGTLITGGKPSTTWAYKGQVLHFGGGLWDQGYGAWGAMRSTPVYLFFRPYGSTKWQYVSYAWTNSSGYFNLYGRAETGGTWEVAWFTGNSPWYVDAYGPGTYVHVR